MATFVLCHGGWAGGWQWKEVAAILRSAGHEIFTPTFTGLGERVHLASPELDLHTYIQDILMVLKYEKLSDVILLGYSMSGAVVTGVAEQAAESLRHLVYLDAFVPEDGQSLADLVGAEIVAGLQQAADLYGDGWRVPHNPPDADRRTDQPLKPIFTPLALKNPAAATIPRAFIYCAQGAHDIGPLHQPIERAAQKAKSDARWRYLELNTGHMPMWTMPQELGKLLLELARETTFA